MKGPRGGADVFRGNMCLRPEIVPKEAADLDEYVIKFYISLNRERVEIWNINDAFNCANGSK